MSRSCDYDDCVWWIRPECYLHENPEDVQDDCPMRVAWQEGIWKGELKAYKDLLYFISSDVEQLMMSGLSPRELLTHIKFDIKTMKEGLE